MYHHSREYHFMYTLENQQIYWNGEFYMLNQGMPTGDKHRVPLAIFLLIFIIRELLDEDECFATLSKIKIKIFASFIACESMSPNHYFLILHDKNHLLVQGIDHCIKRNITYGPYFYYVTPKIGKIDPPPPCNATVTI